MASKNDPFIMRPLKEEHTATNNKFMLLVGCDEDLKRRMTKALEYLASEKAEELRRRVVGKSNEKAETVEKIYKNRMEEAAR